MTRRRYTLLDLLRDEPRARETLSYRDLQLLRRTNDGGRYNVADAAGERLCILDVNDYDSEGGLKARLDDLSATADTDPAPIEPTLPAQPALCADGGGVGHAFDRGDLADVAEEAWPFGSVGTGFLGFVCAVVATAGLLPAGTLLVALLGGVLIYVSSRLARAKGRRAYVEER